MGIKLTDIRFLEKQIRGNGMLKVLISRLSDSPFMREQGNGSRPSSGRRRCPILEVAASIRDGVEHRTGLPSYLILRTDPFFWDMDGPKFDVLEVSVPRVSGREFLKRPYLSCPPSDDHKPCLLKTSH